MDEGGVREGDGGCGPGQGDEGGVGEGAERCGGRGESGDSGGPFAWSLCVAAVFGTDVPNQQAIARTLKSQLPADAAFALAKSLLSPLNDVPVVRLSWHPAPAPAPAPAAAKKEVPKEGQGTKRKSEAGAGEGQGNYKKGV